MPDLVRRLRAAGCVFAEEEAQILLDSARAERHLESLVLRRLAGEPLEHVVGWAEFAGIRVRVGPGVFVPRRRTEELVTHAVRCHPEPKVVVDLCCGSGALGLAFLSGVEAGAESSPELHAADLSDAAVVCAGENLARRGTVHQGDLYDALPDRLRGRVDVLLANTPYVPSNEIALLPGEARDHEPLVTLDGGSDGLDVARRVVDGAGEWLSTGGGLFIEASDRQAPALADYMEARGLTTTVRESVVSAIWSGRQRARR